MKLDEVIYQLYLCGVPTEQLIKEARSYLRDYKDLLMSLKSFDKDFEYIRNRYLKDGEDEVQP